MPYFPTVSVDPSMLTEMVDPGQTVTVNLGSVIVYSPGRVPNVYGAVLRFSNSDRWQFNGTPDSLGYSNYLLFGDATGVTDVADTTAVTVTNNLIVSVSLAEIASELLSNVDGFQYLALADASDPYSGYVDHGIVDTTVPPSNILFTSGQDAVDFMSLTPDQVAAVDAGAKLYNAFGGNDVIRLPDSVEIAGTEKQWDNTQIFQGGLGVDRITGGQRNDKIDGGGGNDTIVGGKGVNTLTGNGGNDSLDGIDYDETNIVPTPDRLVGGTGLDVFYADRQDVIATMEADETLLLGSTHFRFDQLLAVYEGYSFGGRTYFRVFETASGIQEGVILEAGMSAENFSAHVDGTFGYVQVDRIGAPTSRLGAIAFDPAAARDNLFAVLTEVTANIRDAAADDLIDLPTDELRDHAEASAEKMIKVGASSAAIKLASKLNIYIDSAEFAAGAAALILADVRGEIGSAGERGRLWLDLIVETFNPLSNTTTAVGVGSVKLGSAAFEYAASLLVNAAFAPLKGWLSLLGSATPGDDDQLGTGKPDFFHQGAGNDRANGGGGADYIGGGSGEGDDFYDGGLGVDTVSYLSTTLGIVADLKTGRASGVEIDDDTLVSIENLVGGAGRDRLIGNSKANVLDGGEGRDSLKGNGGDDMLIGGSKGDLLVGGSGFDTASYFDAARAVAVDLVDSSKNTGEAMGDQYRYIEAIVGSKFSDTFWGDGGANSFVGGDGNDRFTGRGGQDNLFGGSGRDVFAFVSPDDGIDTVVDFATLADKIELAAAGFGGGLTAATDLVYGSTFFLDGDSLGENGCVIFDRVQRLLSWDADGKGAAAAVVFAVLPNAPDVAAADFIVL